MKNRFLLSQFFTVLFLTGTMESIISGIMTDINSAYLVNSSITGQLITVYSGAFALFGPILITLLKRFSPKKVYLTHGAS